MAHQKWKLLQVTWLPRDTATWTGWSQMESTGGEGQKCEGLSFDSNVPPDPEAATHCRRIRAMSHFFSRLSPVPSEIWHPNRGRLSAAFIPGAFHRRAPPIAGRGSSAASGFGTASTCSSSPASLPRSTSSLRACPAMEVAQPWRARKLWRAWRAAPSRSTACSPTS